MQINIPMRRRKQSQTGGKIFLFLFGLPFFGVGVFMLWLSLSTIFSSIQMSGWHSVSAQITSASLKKSYDSENGESFQAKATYQYQYNGQWYTNDRVAIGGGSDGIGDFQKDLAHKLKTAHKNNRPVTAYVNPNNPQDAIIDRDVRWGMIGFYMIFVIVFGGVGALCLYGALFYKEKKRDPNDPVLKDSPWLAEKDWQTEVIPSNAKLGVYAMWGFAIFWNAISSFLPFVLYEEIVEKQNYPALFGLLFPLVGLGLIYWAVKVTLEWRRFGATPLRMDPYPGSIGGQVGGEIDLRTPYDPNIQYIVTLTNLYSYISGSGKNRSRRESPKWQKEIIAHSAHSINGTKLSFLFDVPEGLHASDADPETSSYYKWRIHVKAAMPGVDLDRSYLIPVYPTGQKSDTLSSLPMEVFTRSNNERNLESARAKIIVRHTPYGTELFYPAGRNKMSAFSGVIFGGVFYGVGHFLIVSEGMKAFGGIFAFVGLLILLFSVYAVSNSLRVWRENGNLCTQRRIFGLKSKFVKMSEKIISKVGKKKTSSSQSGQNHTIYYEIYAQGFSKKDRIILGEGFKNANEADAAIQYITEEMGITPNQAE